MLAHCLLSSEGSEGVRPLRVVPWGQSPSGGNGKKGWGVGYHMLSRYTLYLLMAITQVGVRGSYAYWLEKYAQRGEPRRQRTLAMNSNHIALHIKYHNYIIYHIHQIS